MSDLKHQTVGELYRRRRSCNTYIARLHNKLNGEQQRLKWIEHYIEEKEEENTNE